MNAQLKGVYRLWEVCSKLFLKIPIEEPVTTETGSFFHNLVGPTFKRPVNNLPISTENWSFWPLSMPVL